MKLQVNAAHVDETPKFKIGSGVVLITPPVGEDYWVYRVPVSKTQAIVGFHKFGVIGVGFQYEKDWNTNLPSSFDAEKIYAHIKHNGKGASKKKCLAAIKLIQDAVETSKAA